MSSSSTPSLRDWIVQQHTSFRQAFDAHDLNDWVVCVGNEAADLDTLASSIAFAYFSSLSDLSNPPSPSRHYIPVQQIKSTAFYLRPENMKALELANLLDHTRTLPMPELICSDQIDFTQFTPYGAKYALLDHNRINSDLFGHSAQVVALIDHHQAEDDNKLYPSANPRLIQVPTGSCASLVTDYFSRQLSSSTIPTQIADLLLSAIALDTGDFKTVDQGGKATQSDLDAQQWLSTRSRFSSADFTSLSGSSSFHEYYEELSRLKDDVSNFNSAELLERDYKQSVINGWKLGITSVPIALEKWVKNKNHGDWADFLDVFKQHAKRKEIDIASALTSRLKKKNSILALDDSQLGRRLIIMVIGTEGDQLFTSLEQEDTKLIGTEHHLGLSPLKLKQQASIDEWVARQASTIDPSSSPDVAAKDRKVSLRIYDVQSKTGTRKQVAPVLTSAIQRLTPKL